MSLLASSRRAVAVLLAYPYQRIAARIIAPFAILTLVFAATGTYLTTSTVSSSLQERFDNRLAEAARAAADALVRQERRNLELVRAFAFTEGIAAAIEASDAEALTRLVTPVAANGGVERVEVLDGQGRMIFGLTRAADAAAYIPVGAGEARAHWEIVANVLARRSDDRGDKFSGLLRTDAGTLLYTSAPILRDERLVGVAIVGTGLESILAALKDAALADVTVYDAEGSPVASTFSGGGHDQEADLTLRGWASAFAEGRALKETRTLVGREFALLYGMLRVRGEPAGVMSVALPTDFVTSAGLVTGWRMAILFTVGTTVVFLAGWLISRSLTGPLARLLATARAVTQGDLSARSGIGSRDEIGALAGAFDTMTQKLQLRHTGTIRALASAIDARDPYTLGHSVRVGQLALALGRQIGLPPPFLQHLEIGGYLHDIGKIGVRDAVLLKRGELTKRQRAIIEEHPRIGLKILEPVDLPAEVLAIVGGHHERLNGSGYPFGLEDGDVSPVARIAAVADIYDALTTDRPYRRGLTSAAAVNTISEEAKRGLLDAGVVEALREIVDAWQERVMSDPALQEFALPNLASAAA